MLVTRLCLLLVVVSAPFFAGCSGEPEAADDRSGLMVYVDLETKAAIVAAEGEAPVAHPVTGRRTLMPALYCPKCQRWRPAPALDNLQRTGTALVCPADQTPLTLEGPWPE